MGGWNSGRNYRGPGRCESFRCDDAHPGFAPQPQTCRLDAVL